MVGSGRWETACNGPSIRSKSLKVIEGSQGPLSLVTSHKDIPRSSRCFEVYVDFVDLVGLRRVIFYGIKIAFSCQLSRKTENNFFVSRITTGKSFTGHSF